jgi:hypothetical protein
MVLNPVAIRGEMGALAGSILADPPWQFENATGKCTRASSLAPLFDDVGGGHRSAAC